MQDTPGTPTKPTIADLLHDIVDEMLTPFGKKSERWNTLLTEVSPPFDVSKPNQHDSKRAFRREELAVRQAAEQAKALLDLFAPPDTDAVPKALSGELLPRLDEKIRERVHRIGLDTPTALVRKNAAAVGPTHVAAFMCFDLWVALEGRLRELEEQEERFWNVSHRPPDHHAREIALRLARLFARETGQHPTLGTSPVDGSPSTSFSRALARVFEVLEITANHRGPAEWAVAQLTEEDIEPPKNTIGGLLGLGVPPQRNALAEIASTMAPQERDGS
ncbi:MAG: hypothetical protein AAF674_21295 [Pseudomonadota bacterium]